MKQFARQPIATALFRRYLDRLMRSHFASVRWRSIRPWQEWDPSIPTLAIANHTTWWDGFLSHQVTMAMDRRFRILMAAEHLERYRIFRRVGALPMERRRPREAFRDLQHAARELRGDTILWVYPQGSRRPVGERPARLEGGAGWLVARHSGPVRVVPVAIRIPFLSEQQPDAFVLVGRPWLVESGGGLSRHLITRHLDDMLGTTIDVLDGELATESLVHWTTLVQGKASINNRLDRVRHALGLLPGHQERNG